MKGVYVKTTSRRPAISADLFKRFCVFIMRSDAYRPGAPVVRELRLPLDMRDIEHFVNLAAVNVVCSKEPWAADDVEVVDDMGMPLRLAKKERARILRTAKKIAEPALLALRGADLRAPGPCADLDPAVTSRFDRAVDDFLRGLGRDAADAVSPGGPTF